MCVYSLHVVVVVVVVLSGRSPNALQVYTPIITRNTSLVNRWTILAFCSVVSAYSTVSRSYNNHDNNVIHR